MTLPTTVGRPYEVRVIDRLWIPLSDGTRLAARVWLPRAAGPTNPVPVVVEYQPYRHVDAGAVHDGEMHGYFAGRGYASVHIDLRGSGDSDGILLDEYLPQEIDDGVEAIAWLAAQPWSSGRVGLIGKSWGAFNSLQLAARRPEALAAVIAVMGSDDRYDTDVHYYGGCPRRRAPRRGGQCADRPRSGRRRGSGVGPAGRGGLVHRLNPRRSSCRRVGSPRAEADCAGTRWEVGQHRPARWRS